MAVLGHMGHAELARRARIDPGAGLEAVRADFEPARARRQQAGQHLEDLALSVARDTRHTDDLTGLELDVQAVQAHHLEGIAHHHAARTQQHFAGGLAGVALAAHLHLAPDHGFGQAFDRGVGYGDVLHHAALAHHGDEVAQAHHLLEFVGDQQDRRSLRAQQRQHPEQLLGFLRGQHRGGFIQDQDARPAVQRLEDFQPLPVAHRQVGHQRIEVDPQPGRIHQGQQLGAHQHLGLVQQHMRFGAEHHVLERGQRIDQHEMLVHHADAQRDRLVRVADRGRLAGHLDGAAVAAVKTVQHRHQRALAGAVFPHDAVHRALQHAQVHVGVGQHRTETLVDADHLDRRGTRCFGGHAVDAT